MLHFVSMVSYKNSGQTVGLVNPVALHFGSSRSHPGEALGPERWPVDDFKRRWQHARGACRNVSDHVGDVLCMIGTDLARKMTETFGLICVFPCLATSCLCSSVSRFRRIECFHGTKARRLI